MLNWLKHYLELIILDANGGPRMLNTNKGRWHSLVFWKVEVSGELVKIVFKRSTAKGTKFNPNLIQR